MTDTLLRATTLEALTQADPDTRIRALSIEALVKSFPLAVTITGSGGVSVDFTNDVRLIGSGDITVRSPIFGGPVTIAGAGAITVHEANLAGPITIGGSGSLTVHDRATSWPRDLPSAPTLADPGAGEPVIGRYSLTWPAPTLTNGVPQQGWSPS